MLLELLESGALTCPTCRGWRDGAFVNAPLALDAAHALEDGLLVQGLLRCTGCGLRYPVLDGVAVVFGDVGAWLRQQERPALWREDLAPPLERWLRGAWTEDQDPNWHRQMLAVYTRRLAPPEAEPLDALLGAIRDAGKARLEARRAALLVPLTDPLVLDAGCGVGEATLSAAALGARVLAIDHDMGALRWLSRLLRRGRAEVPRWRHGGADYVSAEVRLPPGVDPRRVALVAADLGSPPLAAATFDLAMAYHVVDNVTSPIQLLRQLHAALRPGATLVLATPYDWASTCTPIAERLGEGVGPGPDPADALRALLTGQLPAQAAELAMEITVDEPAIPWVLVRHRRSAHVFSTHYVEAVRALPGGEPTTKR